MVVVRLLFYLVAFIVRCLQVGLKLRVLVFAGTASTILNHNVLTFK